MSQLKNGEWKSPFWGKPLSLSGGRDPLGMQAPSIASYAILVPGLTNLTRRIRYYGFYCWINQYYAHHIRNNSKKEYIKFIRRSELLYAYTIVTGDDNAQGIVGSDYVRKTLKESSDIEIAKGADRDSGKKTYWKYSYGAFGQYYLGSLVDLGLLKKDNESIGLYLCTEWGNKLAESFDKQIPSEAKEYFFNAVSSGTTSAQALTPIANHFHVSNIKPSSDEWSFYINMLSTIDSPNVPENRWTNFRKETISIFLNYLSKSAEDVSDPWFEIPFHLYDDVLSKKTTLESSPTVFGWFFFALNEFSHYAMTTILWGVLETIRRSPMGLNIRLLTNELSNEATGVLAKLHPDLNIKSNTLADLYSKIDTIQVNEFSFVDKITESIKDGLIPDAIAHSISFLVFLFKKHHSMKDTIKAQSSTMGFLRDGDFNEVFDTIERLQNKPLETFITEIISRRVINRHLVVAMRKISSGEKTTLKFMLQEQNLIHIQTVFPQWTNPRLQSLYLYLSDLGVISNNQLTETGKMLQEACTT